MTAFTIAIPSKGRLKDSAERWLVDCGFKLSQRGGERGYQADLRGLPGAQVMLLPAREIAQGLIDGVLHLGISGEDLLEDLSPQRTADVAVLKRLGFGRADVVVAVPQAWLDVNTMADLDAAGALFRSRHGRRFRVATKYHALTRRYFSRHAVSEYRLVDSAGATEAAPSAGSADLIVDITSTGATLAANHLKVLSDGVMLRSEAVLGASFRADWSEDAKTILAVLLDAVDARDRADALVQITAGGPIPDTVAQENALSFVRGAVAYCPASKANTIARALTAAGLAPVSVAEVAFIYDGHNHALESFLDKTMATC
ncbi:MAG: ATP phosphoribosyltransferase [Pseudomonadota bacterium]